MTATTSDSRVKGRVVALREQVHGVVVELDGPVPARTIALSTSVDSAAARRLRRTVKRVSLVTLTVGAEGSCTAVADGVGHRLPFQRRLAPSTALGLASLGVPALVSYSPEVVA